MRACALVCVCVCAINRCINKFSSVLDIVLNPNKDSGVFLEIHYIYCGSKLYQARCKEYPIASVSNCILFYTMSQLMRLWYLSLRRPAKAQTTLRIRTKNQTCCPTGWLRMRVWINSLWRTKSTINSWHGSYMGPYGRIWHYSRYGLNPITLMLPVN